MPRFLRRRGAEEVSEGLPEEPKVETAPSTSIPDNNASLKDGKSEEDFFGFCYRLENNDSEIKDLKIGEMNDEQAVNLTQSLSKNTTIQKMIVDCRHLSKFGNSVFRLLEFLGNSKSLKFVELQNADLRVPSVVLALTVFLEAMRANANVQDVMLDSHNPSDTLSKTIAKKIWKALPELTKNLSSAFSQCVHLETLWLEHLEETVLTQILPEIANLRNLKFVTIIPNHYSIQTFVGIKGLVSLSPSIQQLEIHGVRFTLRRWEPLVLGLAATTTLTSFGIHDCRFDHAATNAWEAGHFLMLSSTIHTLILGRNVRFAHRSVPAVLSRLLRAAATTKSTFQENNPEDQPPARQRSCALRNLDLQNCEISGIGELLQAILEVTSEDDEEEDEEEEVEGEKDGNKSPKKAKGPKKTKKVNFQKLTIESLSFGNITLPADVDALKEHIPNIQGLRKIRVGQVRPECTEELLDAFKCNADLEKCTLNDKEIVLKQESKKELPKKPPIVPQVHKTLRGLLSQEELNRVNEIDYEIRSRADYEPDEEEEEEEPKSMLYSINKEELDADDPQAFLKAILSPSELARIAQIENQLKGGGGGGAPAKKKEDDWFKGLSASADDDDDDDDDEEEEEDENESDEEEEESDEEDNEEGSSACEEGSSHVGAEESEEEEEEDEEEEDEEEAERRRLEILNEFGGVDNHNNDERADDDDDDEQGSEDASEGSSEVDMLHPEDNDQFQARTEKWSKVLQQGDDDDEDPGSENPEEDASGSCSEAEEYYDSGSEVED
jgi:hypothetical protein